MSQRGDDTLSVPNKSFLRLVVANNPSFSPRGKCASVHDDDEAKGEYDKDRKRVPLDSRG